MAKKIKLEFTKLEMDSMIDIIETIESMYGSSDGKGTDQPDWDDEMRKEIKQFDKMLKRNGYKRN